MLLFQLGILGGIIRSEDVGFFSLLLFVNMHNSMFKGKNYCYD